MSEMENEDVEATVHRIVVTDVCRCGPVRIIEHGKRVAVYDVDRLGTEIRALALGMKAAQAEADALQDQLDDMAIERSFNDF